MLNARLRTQRRLVALAGLLVTVALTVVPTAFAVLVIPDGGGVPRPSPAPGPGDSTPVEHASSSGLEWGQVGVVVTVGLIAALLIAAAAFALTRPRRVRLIDR